MPAVLQGFALFLVSCLVVYGCVAAVGSPAKPDSQDKGHHGHH